MYGEYGFSGNEEVFPAPVSVSELNEIIKGIFDSIPNFRDIYVQGEISNFKNHYATGHFYFTLKDDTSAVKAVMFRTYATGVKFTPENGMKVTVHGRVSVFPRDGQYQIYCDSMEPTGIGSLYAAFEQLKAKLAKEGLFDASAKKQIPSFPKTVGVVTSATGAAVRDIINVLGRRCPMTKVLLYPCLVQGSDAPRSIIAGINYFNETLAADVLIIGRGGGSIEDLWAFNSEELARVIYSSKIPIISAVGHETDFTISDFVSDVRAPTPSAAAEIAVPDISEIRGRLSDILRHITSQISSRLQKNEEMLKRFSRSAVLTDPMAYINEKNMLLAAVASRLETSAERSLEKKNALLSKNAALLNSLSPLSILSRGYSVAYTKDGTPVIRANDVSVGERITVRTSDGSIEAEVTETQN